jgi:uncharacterized membrane protein
MKGFLRFVKTTAVGGIFVVLPVAVIVLVVLQADQLLYDLVSPVAGLFPQALEYSVPLAHALAIVLIVFLCSFTGWIVRTRIGGTVQRGVEGAILAKIPGYTVLKSLSMRFSGDAMDDRFAAAAITVADGTRIVGIITEEHEDEYAVYVPLTPTPGVGTLQFVRKDKVEKLDAPINAVLTAYSQFGVGSSEIFAKNKKNVDSAQ